MGAQGFTVPRPSHDTKIEELGRRNGSVVRPFFRSTIALPLTPFDAARKLEPAA
jgi:hypothetical protein